MPWQIECDNATVRRQRFHLSAPVAAIAEPAMYEDECRRAVTRAVDTQPQPCDILNGHGRSSELPLCAHAVLARRRHVAESESQSGIGRIRIVEAADEVALVG